MCYVSRSPSSFYSGDVVLSFATTVHAIRKRLEVWEERTRRALPYWRQDEPSRLIHGFTDQLEQIMEQRMSEQLTSKIRVAGNETDQENTTRAVKTRWQQMA